MTRIAVAAWTVGLICIALRLYFTLFTGDPSDISAEDASAALAPIAKVPLSSLSLTGSTSAQFEIKPTKAWDGWGAPAYIVLGRAHSKDSSVIPFDSIGIEVQLTIDNEPVALNETKHVPYGYSSNTLDIGRVFSPRPGTAQFTVRRRPPESLRDADLVVVPDWNVAIKDKLVGIELSEELRLLMKYLSWIGAGLIIAGGVTLAGGRKQSE
jgi:hypothetical protein